MRSLDVVPPQARESVKPVVGIAVGKFNDLVWHNVVDGYFTVAYGPNAAPKSLYRRALGTAAASALQTPDGYTWGSSLSGFSKLVPRVSTNNLVSFGFRPDLDGPDEIARYQQAIADMTARFNVQVAEVLVATRHAVMLG